MFKGEGVRMIIWLGKDGGSRCEEEDSIKKKKEVSREKEGGTSIRNRRVKTRRLR